MGGVFPQKSGMVRHLLLTTSLMLLIGVLASFKTAGSGVVTRVLVERASVIGLQRPEAHAEEAPLPAKCARSPEVISALSAGQWHELAVESCNVSVPLLASCTTRLGHYWTWDRQVCGAQRYDPAALRKLLSHKRVAVYGDSHARNYYSWLKRTLDGSLEKEVDNYWKWQTDSAWNADSATGATAPSYAAGDLHLTQHWQTMVPPITKEIQKLQDDPLGFPDVVVISTSSWYYVEKLPIWRLRFDLADLAAAVREADAAARKAGKHVLWLLLSVPTRVRGRNWTASWAAPVNITHVYNKELRSAGLLQPEGPMLLMDIDGLSRSCLHWCSADGIHANAAVYSLTYQITANLLELPPNDGSQQAARPAPSPPAAQAAPGSPQDIAAKLLAASQAAKAARAAKQDKSNPLQRKPA